MPRFTRRHPVSRAAVLAIALGIVVFTHGSAHGHRGHPPAPPVHVHHQGR